MGKFVLEISCNSENVQALEANGEDFRYYLKIKCSNCGEVTDKFLYVCAAEVVPTKTGRSTANMVAKCKNCSREWTLSIEEGSVKPYKWNEDKPDEFQPIAKFEFRGCEPSEFEPRKGWKVHSLNSSTKFEDVDLSELEWADYDETENVSVSIMDLKCRFVFSKH